MNTQNVNLLNQLYKNADMGASSLKALIPEVTDATMRDKLNFQLKNYKQVKAETQLLEMGISPKEQSGLAKAMADISVKLNTFKDRSASHISEMMIEGSNMGIIELNKALNQNPQADDQIKQQANELMQFEQNSINDLKTWL